MFAAREDGSICNTSSGQVVSHRGLISSIQQRDQIQSLFERVFGHRAVYGRFACESCDSPVIEPEVLFPRDESTRAFLGCQMALVLAAQKGMGKSKAVRAILDTIPRKSTILNITFRRVLARGVAASIPNGKTYLEETKSTHFSPKTHPSLTILINSLWRVEGRYDVLILDEWVSILEMLASDLICPMSRVRILDALVRLMEDARLVIVADALLDEPSLQLLDETLPSDTFVRALHYTHQPHAEHTYTFHQGLDSWQNHLLRCLARGERIVVPCLTRAFALRIEGIVRERFPKRSVLTYVADSAHDMEDHMKHIHRAWKVDVLIYSPVITAGCSFEVRGHFDRCFLYAFQGTASVRSALQMTMRVRDLVHKDIHVVVVRAAAVYTRIPKDTGLGALEKCRSLYPWRQDDAVLRFYDRLSVLQRIRDLERTRSFVSTFWDLVAHTGATLVLVPLSSETPIVFTPVHIRGFENVPWHPSNLVQSVPHADSGVPRDWCVSSKGPKQWDVFRGQGYRSPSKVGFGPYGQSPVLRDFHLRDAKLTLIRRWNPTHVPWTDFPSPSIPPWAQRDNKAIWQSCMTLVFARALFARLHLVGRGSQVCTYTTDQMENISPSERSFWSFLQLDGESGHGTSPVLAAERAWRDPDFVQEAHRMAWADCDIRSTPVDLSEDQIEDIIQVAGTGAARWAHILDVWLEGNQNRRIALHPMRPWVQRLRHFGLSASCAPHIALYTESGRVALSWIFSDSGPFSAHDLHRLSPLIDLGASAWALFEGMACDCVVTELCIGLSDASYFVASPYKGRPRGVLASIVQSSSFILSKRRVGVLMNAKKGYTLFIPDGGSCLAVHCANWIRVRGAVRAHGITLLITEGSGFEAVTQLDESTVRINSQTYTRT